MKVKLFKGYSYADGIVFVKKEKPVIEVDEAEGEKLLASGHFELVEDEKPTIPVAEESDEGVSEDENVEEQEDKVYIIPPVDFDKMTVDALKAYAKENEIDISGLTRKDEIKQALLEAINSRVPEIFTE